MNSYENKTEHIQSTIQHRSCLKHYRSNSKKDITENSPCQTTTRVSFDQNNVHDDLSKNTSRSVLFKKKVKEFHSDEFSSCRSSIREEEEEE